MTKQNKKADQKTPDVKELRMVAVDMYSDKENNLWWATCGGFFDGGYISLTYNDYGKILDGRYLIPWEELDGKAQAALEKIARKIIAEDRAPYHSYKWPYLREFRFVFHVTEEDIAKALEDSRPIEETAEEIEYLKRPKGFGLRRYNGKAVWAALKVIKK